MTTPQDDRYLEPARAQKTGAYHDMVVTHLMQILARSTPPPPGEPYAVGSWGPASVERLIAPNEWRLPFARRWRERPAAGNGAGG